MAHSNKNRKQMLSRSLSLSGEKLQAALVRGHKIVTNSYKKTALKFLSINNIQHVFFLIDYESGNSDDNLDTYR